MRNRFGIPLVALVLTAMFLPISVALASLQYSRAKQDLRHSLEREVDGEAGTLTAYYKRARAIVLLLANNPAFGDFYEAPGSFTEKVRAQGTAVQGANEALGYLESLYPNSIGEACFIDARGPEVARVVRGDVASVDELSPDEGGASFFAPTFASEVGEVYQARPYVSPDTGEWVIANSTLIPMKDGSKPAIVHFEVTIESFRREASKGLGAVQVVDGANGGVVIDSRVEQELGSPLGPGHAGHHHAADAVEAIATHPDPDYVPMVSSGNESGSLSVDGRQAAFRRLPPIRGNANDWFVVALASEDLSIIDGIGLGTLALLVFSAGAFVLAVINLKLSHRELTTAATTDSLTGLGNRRMLREDLDRVLNERSPAVLVLFDLDGFKTYNDSFGHPAGDVLLSRLGRRLAESVDGAGRAYRMGGDEFCILADLNKTTRADVVTSGVAALTERGEGFAVGTSEGSVVLPDEAHTIENALRTADQRMYAQKNEGRVPADRQSRDVLLRALIERNRDIGHHLGGVGELAQRVAEALRLGEEQTRQAKQAGELHDIGKIAIPDAILNKPGPLNEEEWEFMRRHTLIGERILAAAPSLASVAKLVRASHECFDGSGYPDEKTGEAIPVGARIVAVCDAFDAMTSDRPYRSAMSVDVALAELRRCAGSQFDPDVVAAFERVVETSSAEAEQI